MKALYLKPGAPAEVIDHPGTLDALQITVLGYVQAVDLPGSDGLTLWMNEDGKSQGLERNLTATLLASFYDAGLAPADVIVGNVLVLVTNRAGDTEGLDEDTAESVLEVARLLELVSA